MKNRILYITLFTVLFTSCSEEKAVPIDSSATVIATSNRNKGEVPKEMSIYTVLSGEQNHSVCDLHELYLSDTRKSEGQDYDANLKNMWMVVLNKRVIREGTDQQKEFLIKEQTDIENNLAHFSNFYKLLLETNSMTKEKKVDIAKEFYDKNKKAIGEIEWQTPEEKKNKETELILAYRSFATRLDFVK